MPLYSLIALFLIILFEVLLFLKTPIIGDFFYIFIWWSYIFFIDGVNFKRNGWSIIKSAPHSLFTLIPWSVTIWLVFELFNLSLKNWHYINLTSNLPLRWFCYAISFGTVLIGLFETYAFLKSFKIFANLKTNPFIINKRLKIMCVLTGFLFLILSIVFPRYCFPLVWGGFYLIIDPLRIIPQRDSLIYDLSMGNPTRVLQLLLAGGLCGFLWEFWNFWAVAKWIYTVPFVGDIKLFEMPVLGFLGFPPFTLECFVMYNFLCALNLAIPWEIDTNGDRYRKVQIKDIVLLLIQIPFWLYSFYLIDNNTVINFR